MALSAYPSLSVVLCGIVSLICAFQLDHELSRASMEVSCHGLEAPVVVQDEPRICSRNGGVLSLAGRSFPNRASALFWNYYTCLCFSRALTVEELGGGRDGEDHSPSSVAPLI